MDNRTFESHTVTLDLLNSQMHERKKKTELPVAEILGQDIKALLEL